jgi:hypothetical protein
VTTRRPARARTTSPVRRDAGRPAGDRHADARDESQRCLLRALSRRVDEGRFSAEDAVDVALVQLARPGGPRLGDAQRAALRRALTVLAGSLTPPAPRALHAFARDAARLAWQAVRDARSPGAVVTEAAHGPDVRAAAQAAVYAELAHARDADELVQRAVRRAIVERRRALPGVPVPLPGGDPLRDLLDLPVHGRVRLPARDVRGTIARVAVDNAAMGTTLRRAARFARHVLEPALGDELWLLCRPVGFTDRHETRVLVATASSLAAQETQLRSRELVFRLRQVNGFTQVTATRVVVDGRAFRGLDG